MEKTNHSVNRVKYLITAACAALFILCLVAAADGRVAALRSDDNGVEFMTEDGLITQVRVRGHFPYSCVDSVHTESTVTGPTGSPAEKIDTYVLQAEISWLMRRTLKIDIETSDEISRTYVLKFSDRDIEIKNGKVVE